MKHQAPLALALVLSLAALAGMHARAATQLVNIDILPESGSLPARYSPPAVMISVGDTVEWVNRDPNDLHNVLFDQLGHDGPELRESESDFVTFSQPGTYSYTCVPHPAMTGIVVVAAGPIQRSFVPLASRILTG